MALKTMDYKQSLKAGIKIESEHRDVMAKLRKYLKTHKRLPPNNKVFTWIAQTHLKEFPKYYTALAKMEKKLKKRK